MKTVNTTKDIINEEKEKIEVSSVSKDEIVDKPFDKIIDSAYTFSSYIPLGGKYATATFDKLRLREKAKNFSNRVFNPFFISKKIKNYFSKDEK